MIKLQLSSYFQQNSQKHKDIDEILQPLLSIVKQNKINSIHQLSDDIDILSKQPILNQFQYNSHNRSNYRKYYSQHGKNSRQMQKSMIQNSPRTQKRKRKSIKIQIEQTSKTLNPNSKIKKHLVQKMKFQSLQSVYSKKSNKFQYFMDTLLDRQKSSPNPEKRKISSQRMQRVRLIQAEQAKQIFQRSPKTAEQNAFKVKNRKIFWRKDCRNSKKICDMRNILCIRGMKQQAITIQ